MKKKSFVDFFILGVLVFGLQVFPARASEASTELQVLEIVRSYAQFLNAGNSKLIGTMLKCVDAEEGLRPSKLTFLLRTKSFTGADLSEEFTCQELLSRYFGHKASSPFNFRKSFRLMQYYSILAQSGGQLESESHQTEVLGTSRAGKMSKYDHPVRGLIDHLTGNIQRMPGPDGVVWDKAMVTYQASIRENCAQFIKDEQKLISFHLNGSTSPGLKDDLCGELGVTSSGRTPERHPALWPILNAYYSFSLKKRKEFREKNALEYYKIISEHPHFLLLRTAKPSLADARSVLVKMQEFQAESTREMAELQGMQLLRLTPLFEYTRGTITALVSKKLNLPVNETGRILDSLSARHRKNEAIKTGAKLSAVFLAVGACYLLPLSKLSFLTKSSCLFSLGLPVDMLMIFTSIQARSEALREFSRTPEFEYLLTSPKSLTAANRDLLLNLLFLPFDVPAKQIAVWAKGALPR